LQSGESAQGLRAFAARQDNAVHRARQSCDKFGRGGVGRLRKSCASIDRWPQTCENPRMPKPDLADRIDALLPQTQCTRCGYPACRAYADAIVAGAADINQCPPGGEAGIVLLAGLLARAPKALNPANGVEKPREIAVIDEETCIGCMKCIQACPVDAIVGASKRMHTILADECSGCELCIPPCPVDCITMVPAADDGQAVLGRAATYRMRFEARNARLVREAAERESELTARKASLGSGPGAVQAAIERARARRAGLAKTDPR
jgi:electron transport complex protein RnfB